MVNPFRAREHKCIVCRRCDAEDLMCYPEDEDCEENYHLSPEDLFTYAPCDFFKPIEDGD